jgi:CMP-N-acetylneuraminic acid synthetase
VISVSEPADHPSWMYELDARQRIRPLLDRPAVLRRQDLAPVYAANGALYFARADWLQAARSFITPETAAFVMPANRSVDLDTLFDWKVAAMLMDEVTQ